MENSGEIQAETQFIKENEILDNFVKTLEEKNLHDFGAKTGEREWNINSFNIQDILNKQTEPILEIGGPTELGYEFLDTNSLGDKLLVSNISPGAPNWDPDGTIKGFHGKSDFQADGNQLPIPDNSLPAVLRSNLPDETGGITKETHRVLKDDGYLILQGGYIPDLKYIMNLGFEPLQLKMHLYYGDEFGYNADQRNNSFRLTWGVFQKKNSLKNEEGTKWHNIAESTSPSKQKIHIPQFNSENGNPLSSEETINQLRRDLRYRVVIPEKDKKDDHLLTSEEKLSYLREKHDVS